MRIEQHLVAAWASQLSDKLIKEAILSLEAMDSQEMLSGESGLKNVWEEICVQVQDEQSFFWGTYVEIMEELLAGHVEMLDVDARLALWTLTNSGWEYIDDHQADDEAGLDIPVWATRLGGNATSKRRSALPCCFKLKWERVLSSNCIARMAG